MRPTTTANILGVILAGGRSRRMGGGDKFLMPLAGRPLIGHVAERLGGQVGETIVSANGDPGRLSFLGLHVVADADGGASGPLGGILAGMREAVRRRVDWILTTPADTPFLPRDLGRRLAVASDEPLIRLAASRGRVHPPVGLWPATLAGLLAGTLGAETDRAIIAFARAHGFIEVDFGSAGADPFFNVNTPSDLDEAARRIGA